MGAPGLRTLPAIVSSSKQSKPYPQHHTLSRAPPSPCPLPPPPPTLLYLCPPGAAPAHHELGADASSLGPAQAAPAGGTLQLAPAARRSSLPPSRRSLRASRAAEHGAAAGGPAGCSRVEPRQPVLCCSSEARSRRRKSRDAPPRRRARLRVSARQSCSAASRRRGRVLGSWCRSSAAAVAAAAAAARRGLARRGAARRAGQRPRPRGLGGARERERRAPERERERLVARRARGLARRASGRAAEAEEEAARTRACVPGRLVRCRPRRCGRWRCRR